MRPDGSGKRLLADGYDKPSNKMGIEAVAFSRDGTRLLACLASEFECSPVAFGISEGRRYVLRVGRHNELTFAVAISRDGTEVLAEAGRLEGPHRVLVVPLAGGEPRVLVRNADHASWSR